VRYGSDMQLGQPSLPSVHDATTIIIIIMSGDDSYLFVPVAAETMGEINKDGVDFLSDLGRRITQSTDDHRESAFIFQLQCGRWLGHFCPRKIR